MARILLVDDCRTTLELLETVLVSGGHQVSSFEVSAESLQALGLKAFDIAMVDYHMPPPDGLEVLQRIRHVQPGCVRILTSGRLELPVLIEAVNRGEVARVLQKPFETAEILSVVAEAIETRDRLRKAFLETRTRSRANELRDLKESLKGDVLELALQPIVDSRTEATVAWEALLRSAHPNLRHPLSVLQAAEEYALLSELGSVITERIVKSLERIPGAHRLFVNLHPAELTDMEALRQRVSRLQRWADRLVFEITERACLIELSGWETSIQLLTDLGFAIALDDLGSGYNSLAMLAQLQPQFIKVDLSIVRDVDRNPRKQRLIRLLSRFARATGATLIAEGVETRAEAESLRLCGANLMQGFLFGRPSTEWPRDAVDLHRRARFAGNGAATVAL